MTFLKLGFISFGGGYAMIPVIQHEVMAHEWMSTQEFTDMVAIAGTVPGPLATNSASLVGYHVAGIPGAITATLGIVLPSLLIIIVLAAFFYKVHRHTSVRASFYGLRPVIAALIVYAALHFGASAAKGHFFSWSMLATLGIAAAGIVAIARYRANPLLVIIGSALLGIILF
ncbi:Chromate transport protein [compost metagenome]